MVKRKKGNPDPAEDPVWTPTQVQFLYRHRNGRHYVRTFAGGKEKWASLRTKLLSVARIRMGEHIETAERERAHGRVASADGKMTFGDALVIYQRRLKEAVVRPNTRAFRESGVNTPPGARSPSRNSTGASASTIKSALDALRLVLDIAVGAGHLHANPARDGKVRALASQIFKAARRQRAERRTTAETIPETDHNL
jgi:hypothetical protein